MLGCGLLELHDCISREEKRSVLTFLQQVGSRKLEKEEGRKNFNVLALIKSPFSEMYASRALASSTPVWATMSWISSSETLKSPEAEASVASPEGAGAEESEGLRGGVSDDHISLRSAPFIHSSIHPSADQSTIHYTFAPSGTSVSLAATYASCINSSKDLGTPSLNPPWA